MQNHIWFRHPREDALHERNNHNKWEQHKAINPLALRALKAPLKLFAMKQWHLALK